jgi:hypothetical protein
MGWVRIFGATRIEKQGLMNVQLVLLCLRRGELASSFLEAGFLGEPVRQGVENDPGKHP